MGLPAMVAGAEQRRDAMMERLLDSGTRALEMFAVYIGDRLGYYEAIAGNGPVTSGELAALTGTVERCAREWLEQQTVAGILATDNADAPAPGRRYYLPDGHDEVLADPESLSYMAPLAQLLAGAMYPLGAVVDASAPGGVCPSKPTAGTCGRGRRA